MLLASQDRAHERSGPLAGLRVIEFASIGPGPLCAMLLADMGAEVLRIDRPGGNGWPNPVIDRGRAWKTADLRSPEGRDFCLDVAAHADIVVEGFRPGVMERLGLGPEAMSARNPRLIFGRITGWGQSGPLAQTAGHDINYIGLTGALAAIGTPDQPAAVPLNLIGDGGGGALYLLAGILAALWERSCSGQGQVVDAAMVDGTVSMMAMLSGLLPAGSLSLARESNLLGGAAPFYRCYRCADGLEIAFGALEPQFFKAAVEKLGLGHLIARQYDQRAWPEMTRTFAQLFATQPRDHWAALFRGSDACITPVLTYQESLTDPHLRARATYADIDGTLQPAPAPRFSRTPGTVAAALDADIMIESWCAQKAGG